MNAFAVKGGMNDKEKQVNIQWYMKPTIGLRVIAYLVAIELFDTKRSRLIYFLLFSLPFFDMLLNDLKQTVK